MIRPDLHHVERRLAAILHADVQGYSRLIGEDEPTTLRALAAHLKLMHAVSWEDRGVAWRQPAGRVSQRG